MNLENLSGKLRAAENARRVNVIRGSKIGGSVQVKQGGGNVVQGNKEDQCASL